MFVLWTGDSAATIGGVFSKDIITFELKNLTDVFHTMYKTFKGTVPIFPVLGNHDSYPQHQLPESDDWVYSLVADIWEPFLPPSAIETLRKHGYYSVKVKNDLRLIVLNTVFYYAYNNKCVGIADPGGQFAWIRSELAEAKRNGEAVYIAGHIPIVGTGGCFRPEFEQPLLDTMKGYHNIIMGSFWGHIHRDTFELYGNSSTNDFHVAHIASTLGSDGSIQPSFRRYMVDTSKMYSIKSWRTFHLDLPEVNKAKRAKWTTLYDTRTAYGIDDATAMTMRDLITRMQRDNALMNVAHKFISGGGPVRSCDATCQKKSTCVMLHPTTKEYQDCIK